MGKIIAKSEVWEKRYEICKTCPSFSKGRINICKECGCMLPAKAKISASSCPLDKW